MGGSPGRGCSPLRETGLPYSEGFVVLGNLQIMKFVEKNMEVFMICISMALEARQRVEK